MIHYQIEHLYQTEPLGKAEEKTHFYSAVNTLIYHMVDCKMYNVTVRNTPRIVVDFISMHTQDMFDATHFNETNDT